MSQSIGYARCSTTHQDTNAQVTELRSAGCQEVFAEKVSSRAPLEKRPQLRRCLETLEVGDELVVSKLDRLGRSQVEVINRLSDLQTPPLPGKMTPLQPNQYHPPGGLMEQSNASLQRDGQS